MKLRSILTALLIFTAIVGTRALAQDKAPMLVGGQLELCLPMGEYADKVDAGFGFVGNFHYGVQPRLWLVGSVGYESFPRKNANASIDGSDGSFFIHAGARYELSEGDGVIPYVGAKIGLHYWSWSITQKQFVGSYESSESDISIGLSPMFGVLYPITETITLDAALKYTILVRDKNNGNDATHFAIQAGVLIPLNL